jgi:hypothetical protein
MKKGIIFLLMLSALSGELYAGSADKLLFRGEHDIYYRLWLSKDRLKISGYKIDLSLSSKQCNRSLVNSLRKDIEAKLHHIVTTKKRGYLLEWKGRKYNLSRTSVLGSFLRRLPELFVLNKRKESFLCRGNN